jgi:hypothetical protein
MTNNRQMREEIRSYFAEEPVPQVVHERLLFTCRNLEPRPHKEDIRRPLWRKVAVSSAALAAAFVLLCGVNAANPAFAESIPLIGKAFRLYNEGKTTVGTYMGTYEGVVQVGSTAVGENSHGLSLTLDESYCDGKYVHLTFTMEGASSQVLDDLYYLSGKVSASMDGRPLEAAYLDLYPEGDILLGAVSLPLNENLEDSTVMDLSYQVTDLVRFFDDGGNWEELPGSFQGQLSVTVDTSHNQVVDEMESEGTIQINWVESTPSYTKINYTIPFWGISSYTIDFPRLYLEDGTSILQNLNQSEVPSPSDISRDAETITGTACFDGLPNGTEKVILRFLEEDVDDASVQAVAQGGDIGVLGEVTIDLSTGKAVSSETYLDAGMIYADNYREHFSSIDWTMPFDDPDMIALGQTAWKNVTAIPGLFQNGHSLWSVEYDGKMNVAFVTDGTKPDTALNVSVTNERGNVIAKGILSPGTSMKQSAGGDSYYLWDTVLDPMPGNEPQLLDTVTVTLTDQDSGETVYKRSVRLVSKD